MALVGLTGFETFSRVLLGWFGRMVTKDSLSLKNQLVNARIPLLPDDYVASSAMQVVLAFLGGVAFSLAIVGFLVPQLETMQDPTKADGENFAVSNVIQYAIIGLLVFVLPALIGLVQFLTNNPSTKHPILIIKDAGLTFCNRFCWFVKFERVYLRFFNEFSFHWLGQRSNFSATRYF